jgi:hypothetical protein
MTARIEKTSSGRMMTIRLTGRIQSDHLDELNLQIADIGSQVTLDLAEVTLVDVDVVHFLGACELNGITLLNCPAYIREWIHRERAAAG